MLPDRNADHDPSRVDVRRVARFDAGDHVGFGAIDELVHQALEPFG